MRVHVLTPARPEEAGKPAVPARVGRLNVDDAEGATVLRDLAARGDARLVIGADTPLDDVLALFGGARP